MEKEQGKDYFGFAGQAENYQKYRPQYPKEFVDQILSAETLPSLKKREICIDLGTGTGLLAKHFAGLFTKVIGTDLSEAQLKQAAESHKDVANLTFKQLDVKHLPEFLTQEGLDSGSVDLFTIGQALHWFDDIDGTLKTVNSVLRDDSYFTVFAYTIPRINDGSDWQTVMTDKMSAKGYDVIDGTASSYKFEKDPTVHSKLSGAYNNMWDKIYKHFRFNRSVIEDFYQPFNFAEHANVLRRVIWFDAQRDRAPQAVLGYLESVSAYRCYLEDYEIAKGSEEDPLEQVKKVFEEAGNPKVDFVTPYFAIALGKKQ